jgi:hypothetical protein
VILPIKAQSFMQFAAELRRDGNLNGDLAGSDYIKLQIKL